MDGQDGYYPRSDNQTKGITIRDKIAIEAMKGILSGPKASLFSKQELVVHAFLYADNLIEQSNIGK